MDRLTLRKKRRRLMQHINQVYDSQCVGCQIKKEIRRQSPEGLKPETHAIHYCIRECPYGLQLQKLGQKLGDDDSYMPDHRILQRTSIK